MTEEKYLYNPTEGTLFPFAMKEVYEEAGSWPEEGFEIPAEVAHELLSKENRNSFKIVKKPKGKFAVEEVQDVS